MALSNNALNFEFLLLDYYKELKIDENELVVLLMIEHLNSQNNNFITSSNLALKMSLREEEIDHILTSLYKKRLIDINVSATEAYTSIEPIKKIVFKKFQEDLFGEEELNSNDELEETRSLILTKMEELFSRSLTPVEVNRVDDWLMAGTPKNIILDSIKDAKLKDCSSINQIDSIILKKMRDEDGQGNVIKR